MKGAYYNEIDPYCAEWLRNLITLDLIAPGDVDTRSIEDVTPDDLKWYSQCHFFAGIGGWSLALRLAGWPDDRPVWTGSCPCQPFSAAGRGLGAADERHLWPAWFHLIEQCRPAVVFGEQVEAAIKHGWLDLVQADLEGIGYAVGAAGLPAAGVGAPHQRARLWFVGHADGERAGRDGRAILGAEGGAEREVRRVADRVEHASAVGLVADGDAAGRGLERGAELLDGERPAQRHDADRRSTDGSVADRQREGLEGHARHVDDGHEPGRLGANAARPVATGRGTGDVADPERDAAEPRRIAVKSGEGDAAAGTGSYAESGRRSVPCGYWSDCDWLPCRDGKARPVEPGSFPLAHGVPARVGRLRAYGNAIVPQVAAEFIGAYLDCRS